jgi:hypothetical protein
MNGPDTAILSGPGTSSSSTTATFSFETIEPQTTFECKLDAGAWVPCVNGASYAGLAEGGHTFWVRAIDSLSNVGDDASYAWAVDTQAPP